MSSTIIANIERDSMRLDIPPFRVGDTVKVHVKIREGDKERIQVFEGVVIRHHRGGLASTFTVRKVSYGVGVERIFPVHSPQIDSVEILRRGDVRRARLYYLRDRVGKAARIKEKR
jgi:large subunit ribosomal protein L19